WWRRSAPLSTGTSRRDRPCAIPSRSSPRQVLLTVHRVLGQLSEIFGNASGLGEHDRRIADRGASETGSYRVHRPIDRPAGRTGRGARPMTVAAELHRQLELEGVFV